jgi:hypothetical protein
MSEGITIIETDQISGLREFFHDLLIKLALQTYTLEYTLQASMGQKIFLCGLGNYPENQVSAGTPFVFMKRWG